jgi:hypothetical protein
MIVDQAMAPQRIADDDGTPLDVFPLPVDEATLVLLLRDLFETHWDKIVFGPLIQGAAWEIRAEAPPTKIGMLDGYLTLRRVAFPSLHRRAQGFPPPSDAAGTGAPPPHRARRAVPSPGPLRGAVLLGAAPVQRCRRAADHDLLPESVPVAGWRPRAAPARLVAACPVGRDAGALHRRHRSRSRRPGRQALPPRLILSHLQ